MATTVDTPQALPTADNPEYGTVGMFDQRITDAAYWFEAGDHVLRSLEFDVIAGGTTFEEAVGKLIDNVEDLADAIADLDEGDATPDEAQVALAILQRFVAAYEEGARRERERLNRARLRRLLRGRRRTTHQGFRPSSRQTSSPAQLVS